MNSQQRSTRQFLFTVTVLCSFLGAVAAADQSPDPDISQKEAIDHMHQQLHDDQAPFKAREAKALCAASCELSLRTAIPFWPRGFPMSSLDINQTIDETDQVVTIEMSGDVVDQDLLNLAAELEKDPRVQPQFSLLIDLRRAKGWKGVSSAGVRALAEQTPVVSAMSRRAVVVPTRFGFGMARMYELRRDGTGVSMKVFFSYSHAKRWVTEGR